MQELEAPGEPKKYSKVRSDVITEESSVLVCPLNEERGFVAYIFS